MTALLAAVDAGVGSCLFGLSYGEAELLEHLGVPGGFARSVSSGSATAPRTGRRCAARPGPGAGVHWPISCAATTGSRVQNETPGHRGHNDDRGRRADGCSSVLRAAHGPPARPAPRARVVRCHWRRCPGGTRVRGACVAERRCATTTEERDHRVTYRRLIGGPDRRRCLSGLAECDCYSVGGAMVATACGSVRRTAFSRSESCLVASSRRSVGR
jgi:hypothetical protein